MEDSGAALIKRLRVRVRALKGLVEDIIALAGQLGLLAGAIHGFYRFLAS